jgi:hypothetical protein
MRTFIDFIPIGGPLLFAGIWLLVGMILSHVSGWASLAERYAATGRPAGHRLWGQVVSVGPVRENGITGVAVGSEGLYLFASPLFRFGRRRLLIPWRAVKYLSERKVLWWRSYKLDLDGITTVRVREKAFTEIAAHISPGASGCTAR